MAGPQGWDRADFSCGRCGHKFTATIEAEYLNARELHDIAHSLAEGVLALPGLREQVLKLLDQ